MNDFLQQFLVEAREIATQGAIDLQALQRAPADRALLENTARALHTLKGAAGIVEFQALGTLTHRVEDVLAAAVSSGHQLSPDIADHIVACFDLIEDWLGAIEATGDFPRTADSELQEFLKRLDTEGLAAETAPAVVGDATTWLNDVFPASKRPANAVVALRYAPEAESYFRNEDPLALIAELPGLCALEMRLASPLPDVDDIDPFKCNLLIFALSDGPADDVIARCAAKGSQIQVHKLAEARDTSSNPFSDLPRTILEAQLRLLELPSRSDAPAIIGAVGRTVGNLLVYLSKPDAAAELMAIAEQGMRSGDAAPLAARTEQILREVTAGAEIQGGPSAPQQGATGSIRVDSRRIDAIVKLTGELTIAKNALAHLAEMAAGDTDRGILAAEAKQQHLVLDRLAVELQQAAVALRVVPLRQIFQRFPRVLREIASGLGKKVELRTEGDGTEADRQVVENLFEPLVHVLRNAVDHGIETAEQRRARGKPASASILLRGYREGDRVIVEVSDDGRGIDVDRVKRVAVQRGLITEDNLASLSEREAIDMIFLPGFSTAADVSDLSGRGVGMDAVRAAVERLSGSVAIETALNIGTTVRFELPFTVMMSRVMTVEVGDQVFGLPFEAIVEMLHVPRRSIFPVGATQAIVFRDTTIPLLGLNQVLGNGPSDAPPPMARVVVLQVGDQLGGLEVDRLGQRMDLMLSPRSGLLAGIPGIAGTTLLGDGRVLVVLDIEEILQ
jgi:two-component system chemotaxis sensor kinase CheA